MNQVSFVNCKNSTTMNSPLSKVVQLNNFGVTCYENKDYQRAVILFREALKWISSPAFLVETVAPESSVVDPFAPILKAKVPCDETCTDVQSFLRFNQAMEIVDFQIAYSVNPMANEVLLSAMIIWNMAVVYNCTSCGDRNKLTKSYALYIKSWNLVEYLVYKGSNGNPMMDFFTQALLNNLGCCCQELDLHAEAQMWSDQLISYAQSMGLYHADDSSDVSTKLQEQTNHFVLNAIMLL